MELEVLTRRSATPTTRPPLLFVHGAWVGAWMWEEHFLGYFADRGHDAHAVSLRGHGRSPIRGSLRWTALDAFVDDVAAAAASLERPPVVVGHSMGGLVVQRFIERHAAAAAVLLCSAPPGGVRRSTLRVARRHPLALLRANLTLSSYALVEDLRTAHDLVCSANVSLERFRPHHARLRDDSFRAFVEMLAPRVTPRRDLPVMVLGAGADFLFDDRDLRDTGAAYGVPAHSVPGLGHTVTLEPAWEEVARRIAEWVEG